MQRLRARLDAAHLYVCIQTIVFWDVIACLAFGAAMSSTGRSIYFSTMLSGSACLS